jgi:methyltransferase (TIGR00027 family)
MALFRAIESNRPASSRLFEDRLATGFLDPGLRCAAMAARLPLARGIISRFIDRRWPGPRGSGIVRTRIIDDALLAALADGASQVVLLGAGFDSRAYRISGIERTRVFELDQPATIASKRAGVCRRLGGVPEHVAFVPVDFNTDDVANVLRGAGFASDAPACFIWEGVTNYLTADAVNETLRDIAKLAAPGSVVVFTYVHCDALEDPARFEGARQTITRVRRVGEPFRFGFDPAELASYLRARGLVLTSDEATAEAARRYLGPLGREERVFGFYRVAVARVDRQQSVSPAGSP